MEVIFCLKKKVTLWCDFIPSCVKRVFNSQQNIKILHI